MRGATSGTLFLLLFPGLALLELEVGEGTEEAEGIQGNKMLVGGQKQVPLPAFCLILLELVCHWWLLGVGEPGVLVCLGCLAWSSANPSSSIAAEGPVSSRSVHNAAQSLFRRGSLLQYWLPERPENSFPVL